ncbi:hypothetical protein MKX01_019373, partial [Papaver californicum]
VLSDRVNHPGRLLKWSYYTGTNVGAVNLIKIGYEWSQLTKYIESFLVDAAPYSIYNGLRVTWICTSTVTAGIKYVEVLGSVQGT